MTDLALRPTAVGSELRIRIEGAIEGADVAARIARLPGPRLVIDLPRTRSALASHRVETGDALIRRIRVGVHPDHLRIVLDLAAETTARCVQDEQGVLVEATGPPGPTPTPRSATPSPTSARATPSSATPGTPVVAPGTPSPVGTPSPSAAWYELQPAEPAPRAPSPGAPSPRPAPSAAPRVSLDFDHADVRAVLDMIARSARREVIFFPSVRGRVSVHLDDLPWKEAFDLVLRKAALRATFHEDLILVGPAGRS